MEESLKKRIIGISKNLNHNHIGSSLTALPIILSILKRKFPGDKFILSCGHAALALYVATHEDNEALPIKNNLHADKSWSDCSTGSLGHGLGIAVGMALAYRQGKKWDTRVFCLVSDGELAEGSCWEALRVAKELGLDNLLVYCNANGWASYKDVDLDYLEKRIKAFEFPVEFIRTKQEEPFTGLNGHYGKAK